MASKPFDWQPAFLNALRSMPIIRHACDAVGINRSTAWRAREADEMFAKAWDDALVDGIDRAEQAAMQRAVDGWEEPVIDKGRLAYRYERYEVEDIDGRKEERWRMTLRLKAPHGARNPHGFDYELYLWEQGVQATGTVALSEPEPATLVMVNDTCPVPGVTVVAIGTPVPL
mgnify:CR=1 FL=1